MASKKHGIGGKILLPGSQSPTIGKPAAVSTGVDAAKAATPETSTQGSSINKSVFYVGIGLALILGLYVGSLVPSLLERAPAPVPGIAPEVQPGIQTSATPPDVQPPAAPQEKSPPIPPEVQAKLAAREQAVLAKPQNAAAWTELGNLYFDTGQSRKAASAYERSLSIAPDNADVLTDLGIMYREMGEFEKAVTSFRRASSVNPRHENAMFNEGVVLYFDLKRKEDAMKAWQRLLAVNPGAHAPDGQKVSDVIKNLR